MQKTCLARRPDDRLSPLGVVPTRRMVAHSGNIIAMENTPLSVSFSFLEWDWGSWFSKVFISHCSDLISTGQSCVRAFQVTDVYVKLSKMYSLGTQLLRYHPACCVQYLSIRFEMSTFHFVFLLCYAMCRIQVTAVTRAAGPAVSMCTCRSLTEPGGLTTNIVTLL